jgi:hypothetical protein
MENDNVVEGEKEETSELDFVTFKDAFDVLCDMPIKDILKVVVFQEEMSVEATFFILYMVVKIKNLYNSY